MKKNTASPIASASVGPTIIATITPIVKTTRLVVPPVEFVLETAVFVGPAAVDVAPESVLVNVLSKTLVRVVDCAAAEIVSVYVSVYTE